MLGLGHIGAYVGSSKGYNTLLWPELKYLRFKPLIIFASHGPGKIIDPHRAIGAYSKTVIRFLRRHIVASCI